MEDMKKKLEAEYAASQEAEVISPPTMLLWLYYFLALHLAHPTHPSPDYARSLDLLETALRHTPTLPEIYMAQAMVLKRAGDPDGAARSMEKARLLDGQDRFLNGKTGKYWLRAGEVEKATSVFGLFTKVSSGPVLYFDCRTERFPDDPTERCLVTWSRSHRHAMHLVLAGRRGCCPSSWKASLGGEEIRTHSLDLQG